MSNICLSTCSAELFSESRIPEVVKKDDDPFAHRRVQAHHVFWYIDFKHFVDVVKYKLCIMQKSLSTEVEISLVCGKESCKTK